ncbi:MAG TPA: phosphoribosylformylglycinamidine synthase subunit PurS [candidate division Zixibacteria bacterium]|nr:phosphoribosylformylglycinamidine synthase subunit PurS [candidate division Zixibacteria bacterium]
MKNFSATVRVHKKQAVADPEGKTIGKALNRLGYNNVKKIRLGKVFSVEISAEGIKNAREIVEKISREILSNPIIEDFDFDIKETA